MNRIEENNHKMEQEATDIFDAFINAAEIEVKEEPRVEIYRAWCNRYKALVVRWAIENIALAFGCIFAIIFLWRTEFQYGVRVAFRVLTTLAVLIATRRIYIIRKVF